MIESVIELVESGIDLFNDERKRQILEDMHKLIRKYQKEKGKRFPDYNDENLEKAKQELKAFRASIGSQIKQGIKELKELANV